MAADSQDNMRSLWPNGDQHDHSGSAPRTGRSSLEQGIEATRRGDLEVALGHFDEALGWAQRHQDGGLWDRAFCNRSAIELELGRTNDSLAELRQIVLRSGDTETGYLAASNAARAYELQDEPTRALFYARIARDRCLKLERRDWLSWSENQIGNLHLALSAFEEACTGYELALKLMPLHPSIERAMILDNLGYCRLVQGRYREGFAMLFQCLRTLIAFDGARFLARPRLSLCYGYLEINRHRSALRHGQRALELATRFEDHASIKNAQYLLGETYSQMGDIERARGCFEQIQQRYYPEARHLPDLLLAFDLRPLINLKKSN